VDTRVYANGVTKDQQLSYNNRYRAKQAHNRRWLQALAEQSQMPMEALTTPRNAEIIAEILRRSPPRP
jgi:hypothetical protein